MHLPHFYLSIHLSMDIWVVCIFVIVNNATMNMCIQVTYLSSLLSIFSGTYPEVALLTKYFCSFKRNPPFAAWHPTPSSEPKKKNRIRLENQSLQRCWSRKPHRVRLSVGRWSQKCLWRATPAVHQGLQPKPLTSSLDWGGGWEFWVQHPKCAFIKEGFVGYRECS